MSDYHSLPGSTPAAAAAAATHRGQDEMATSSSTAAVELPRLNPSRSDARYPASPPTPAPSPRPHVLHHSSSQQRLPSHSSGLRTTSGSTTSSSQDTADADQSLFSELDQSDLDGMAPSNRLAQSDHHLRSWHTDPQALTRAATALLPTLTSSARVTLLSDLLLLLSSQELAQISSFVSSRLRIDFLSALPIEVSLHVLSFIDDPLTLARASQVNRFWRSLVNDEHTWEAMCLKYRYRYRRPSLVYPRGSKLSSSRSSAQSTAQSTASDADLLASLYRRYRERGLDPSNARDELRTLHDLFLQKQSADPNAIAREPSGAATVGSSRSAFSSLPFASSEMSSADLRFYEQLEQIVQEESRARYGDGSSPLLEAGVDRYGTVSDATPRLSGTGGETNLAPTSETVAPPNNVGWLSAGPPAASRFPRTPTLARSRLPPLTGPAANVTFDSSRSRTLPGSLTSPLSSWTSGLGLPWGLSDLISLPAALGGGGGGGGGGASRDATASSATSGYSSPSASTAPNVAITQERRSSSHQRTAREHVGIGRPSSQREAAAEAGPAETAREFSMTNANTQRQQVSSSSALHSLSSLHNTQLAGQEADPFSYKAHFKRNYLTESNWHRGGHLLSHHISTESGSVCTCMAMDQRWLVVGMANGKIHLFDARTGLFARTLQGRHDSGVWCLALVSRTKKAARRPKEMRSERAKGKGRADADRKGKGKGKVAEKGQKPSPYASSENNAEGQPEYLTPNRDLRLVRHDPRLLGRVTGRHRKEHGAEVAGAAHHTSDDQTLLWFHKARQVLDGQRRLRDAQSRDPGSRSVSASAVPSWPSGGLHEQNRRGGNSSSSSKDTIGGLPRDMVEAGEDFVADSIMAEAKRTSGAKLSAAEQETMRLRIETLRAEITKIRKEHGITGHRRIPRPAMRTPTVEDDDDDDAEMSAEQGSPGDVDMEGVEAGPEEDSDSDEETMAGDSDEEEEYEGFSMGIGGSAQGLGTLCSSTRGFGNEDTLLVSGGCDREVKVWNLETGALLFNLRGHLSTVRCLRVLEGRPVAISGGRDGTVRVWDISGGKELRVLPGHLHSVRCMEVAGNRVATGSYDSTCRIWDVDTGECLHVLRGHYNQIYCIGFDGNKVATGSLDSTVRVWSAETGEPLALLQGHTALVGQLQLTNNMLISGGSDGRIIAYSLDPSHPRNAAADANASAASRNQPVSLGVGGSVTNPRGRGTSNVAVHPMSGAPTAGGGGAAAACNSFTLLYAICAHDNSVSCLQFDEHFILTGGNDGTVRLWNLYDGSFVRELVKPTAGIWKLAFRDDKIVWVAKQEDESLSMGVVDFRPVEEDAALQGLRQHVQQSRSPEMILQSGPASGSH